MKLWQRSEEGATRSLTRKSTSPSTSLLATQTPEAEHLSSLATKASRPWLSLDGAPGRHGEWWIELIQLVNILRSGQTCFTALINNINWLSRRGAPFFHYFQELMQRMEDAGITNQWLKEVIDRRVKRNRAVEEFMSSGAPGNPWVSPKTRLYKE